MARVLFANIKGPPGAPGPPGEPGPQGPPGPMPEVGEIPGLDEALSNLQASIDSVTTAVGQLTVIVETPVDISKVVGLSDVLTGFETMIQELFGIAEQPITIDKVTDLSDTIEDLQSSIQALGSRTLNIDDITGLTAKLGLFETQIQGLTEALTDPITIDKVTGLEEALAADIPASRVTGLGDLVDDAVESVLPGLIVAVPEANWPPADTPGVIYVRVP